MPVGINGVDKQGIGVNGVQTKQALSAASETVAKGVYNATTLSAVDADLAVGNIKNLVTIFSFVGTAVGGALSQDIVGSAVNADNCAGASNLYNSTSIPASSDFTYATLAQVYDAASMAVAAGFGASEALTVNTLKMRVYMDGVQVAESAYIPTTSPAAIVVIGTKALSGNKTCYVAIHNYDAGSARNIITAGGASSGVSVIGAAIGCGSIKLS